MAHLASASLEGAGLTSRPSSANWHEPQPSHEGSWCYSERTEGRLCLLPSHGRSRERH